MRGDEGVDGANFQAFVCGNSGLEKDVSGVEILLFRFESSPSATSGNAARANLQGRNELCCESGQPSKDLRKIHSWSTSENTVVHTKNHLYSVTIIMNQRVFG